MRAGSIIFLFGLSFVHVSLSVRSTFEDEEPPAALADGTVLKDGYVFDGDTVFANKANSFIKRIADIMKYRRIEERQGLQQCYKAGPDKICLDINSVNLTDLAEEFVQPTDYNAGLTYNGVKKDKTLVQIMSGLMTYSYGVMKYCTSLDCRYYKYCIKMGGHVYCITITLKKSAMLDEEDNPDELYFYLKYGYIFDDDDIFNEKAGSLLKHSIQTMRTCITKACRNYMLCHRAGQEIICISVWLSTSKHEFLSDLLGILNAPNQKYNHQQKDDQEVQFFNGEIKNFNKVKYGIDDQLAEVDGTDDVSEGKYSIDETVEEKDYNGEPLEETEDNKEPSEGKDSNDEVVVEKDINGEPLEETESDKVTSKGKDNDGELKIQVEENAEEEKPKPKEEAAEDKVEDAPAV